MRQGNWSPENFKNLQVMLEGPAGLAAFDFDNTLIYNDLGESCMYYIALQGMLRGDRPDFWEALKHPIIPTSTYDTLRGLWDKSQQDDQDSYLKFVDELMGIYTNISHQIGLESAYRWTKVLFGGHTKQELQSVATYVFEMEQERQIGIAKLPSGYEMNTGIRIYEEIRDLIKTLKEKGWKVLICTASPIPLIQAVIHHWGLEQEDVTGMRLTPDTENPDFLLPEIVEPMAFGPGKVTLLGLSNNLPLRFAAGDSWTDFNMLLHAENALLIDRESQEHLAKRAIQSGFWTQKRFIQPQ